MVNDALELILRLNLAAGAAVMAVLALRSPFRRWAGPGVGYGLWLAVPASALASLLPPRTVVTFLPEPARAPAVTAAGSVSTALRAPMETGTVPMAVDWLTVSLWLWAVGVAAGLTWLICRQARFVAAIGEARRDGQSLLALTSRVGPAVVGVFNPKILLPADFHDRFSARERDVVLAHERNHLAKGDARIKAVVLLCQCLGWFNPLIHIGAKALRLDQELACDATVMARYPKARRSYAEAMLKTQLAQCDLPLGCYWPATGRSALKERLSMLKAPPPSTSRVLIGAVGAIALSGGAGLVAWAAQPPEHAMKTVSRAPTPAQSAALTAPPVLAKAARGGDALQKSRGHVIAQRSKVLRGLDEAHEAAGPIPSRDDAAEINNLAVNARILGSLIAQADRRSENLKRSPVAAQPKRTPAELRSGTKVVLQTQTRLPAGNIIGGLARFTQGSNKVTGNYDGDPHYAIASSIRQVGGQVEVSPKITYDGHVIGTGKALLSSGVEQTIVLSNGQMVRANVEVSQATKADRDRSDKAPSAADRKAAAAAMADARRGNYEKGPRDDEDRDRANFDIPSDEELADIAALGEKGAKIGASSVKQGRFAIQAARDDLVDDLEKQVRKFDELRRGRENEPLNKREYEAQMKIKGLSFAIRRFDGTIGAVVRRP